MIERSHHYAYAVAIVLSVGILAYFFAPHHAPVEKGIAVQQSVPSPGTIQRELEAVIQSERALAAANGTVPGFERAAVNIIPHSGFSDAAIAQVLTALGRPKTAPTYHVNLVAPTPMPAASLPPNVSQPYADWLYTTAYNADQAAINNAKINVHVTQDPIPPSRTQTLYLSDKSAGIAYALRRRGQLDLDLGLTQGKGTEVFAGPCYRIKDTSSGVCVGGTYRFGPQSKPGIAAGFTVSF